MFYVYKVIDKSTKEYYIGSRKYKGKDPYDDKYLGSPYIWKPNISNLVKIIIKDDFKSMEEAILYERELIIKNIDDKLNRNYSIPYGRFHRVNLITAVSRNGKVTTIHKDDPLFGVEYFGITKGKVLVRDRDNNILLVSTDDDRYLSGELIHNNKFIMPKGKNHPNWGKKHINNGVKQKIISTDEIDYYLNNGWILGTLQKNKKTVSSHYDRIWITKDNKNKRVEEKEIDYYLNNGWLKGRTFNKKYNKRNK